MPDCARARNDSATRRPALLPPSGYVLPVDIAAGPGHLRPPTFMEPAKAAAVLRDKVDPRAPLTVADAAARSGLALRDAEAGLTWLSSEYRGQLRVTADGDLVHLFPSGFTKPWEAADARRRFFRTV